MRIVIAELALPYDEPSAEAVRDRLLRSAEPRHGLQHVYVESRNGAVQAVLFLSHTGLRAAEQAARELCLAYCAEYRDGSLIRVGATIVAGAEKLLLSGWPDEEQLPSRQHLSMAAPWPTDSMVRPARSCEIGGAAGTPRKRRNRRSH